MKNSLLIFHQNIRHNPPFFEYLTDHIRQSVHDIDLIEHLPEGDKDTMMELGHALEKSQNILIATSKNFFSTAAKLLATLTDDSLVYNDDMLLPSKASLYAPNSFLVNHEGKQINLFQISEGKNLPEILIQSESKEARLHLFKVDHESAQILLTPTAENYNITLSSFEFIKGWSIATAKSQRYGDLSSFIAEAKGLLPGKIIASQNLIPYIIERFKERELTISFAESCTGGLLAQLFTQMSGVSSIFPGSVISYSNHIKQSWLKVNEQNLELYGAVSESVLKDMLDGILGISGAHYAMAISGVAGPTGGSDAKPVGTVFVGAKSWNGKEFIERICFEGDRRYIQQQAAYHAVMQLIHIAEDQLF